MSHSHNGSFDCVQDMSSALICLLIQMSYGNVETILGANMAGREIVKTCLLVPVFKASLPISQSCPPPHLPPTSWVNLNWGVAGNKSIVSATREPS